MAEPNCFTALRQSKVNTPINALTMDEMSVMGQCNSTFIQTLITNTGIIDLTLVLGTPVGDPAQAGLYPNIVAQITNLATSAVNIGNVTDSQGVGATFIQAINKRFCRKAVFCKTISVVSTNDAQRSEQLGVISVPYQSSTDSSLKTGRFNPVDTQFTGNVIPLLGKEGAVLGEFSGVTYKLLVGQTVKMTIEIAALDVATFKACN